MHLSVKLSTTKNNIIIVNFLLFLSHSIGIESNSGILKLMAIKKTKARYLIIAPLTGAQQRFTTLEVAGDWQ